MCMFDVYGESRKNLLEILAVVMGARRQGAVAPQLPRATRSPKLPSEDFGNVWGFGGLKKCFYICFQVSALR